MPTQTFTFSGNAAHTGGSPQTFVVPDDVNLITIECWGAEGGDNGASNTAGKGGYIKGQIPVSAGETLNIYVGGNPQGSSAGSVGGYNGGGTCGGTTPPSSGHGGGGASDVRRFPYTLADRLIVAGGGGGEAVETGFASSGGDGGYPNGGFGGEFNDGLQGSGGGGATSSAGGGAGTGNPGNLATAGTLGLGGNGSQSFASNGGGGGGGGLYGGGGGGWAIGTRFGDGGGGSSAVIGGGLVSHTTGARTGDGQVVFTWSVATTSHIEDQTEWEVKVFDATNPNPFTALIAVVPRWTLLKYTRPLSDLGAGEIQLLRDDQVLKDHPQIVDGAEHIWAFYDNGELRFTMLNEDVDKTHVDDQERPVVKITGRNGAKFLDQATILPPGYPTFTEKNHNYLAVPGMWAWMDVYQEAETRGVIPGWLFTTADNTFDTVGFPYPDVSSISISPGGSLLQLLKQWGPVSEIEWEVTPQMEILIKNSGLFGLHQEAKVVFNVGNSIVKFGEKKTRRDIKSHIYVEAGDGSITEANDSSVATQWGRRELWMQSGQSSVQATGANVAAAALNQIKNEARELTVEVRPYMTNRKVWIDYGLGDWVTLESDAEADTTVQPNRESVKVLSIGQAVDENGRVDTEIVFSTRLQQYELRMLQIIGELTGQGNLTSSSTSSTITAPQVVGASSLNDLNDVIITSPAVGAGLVWNGTDWVDGLAAVELAWFGDESDGAVSLTQSSSAPAWATKSGSGTSTLFTLTRDVYASSIHLDNTNGAFSVFCSGFRIFCSGTFTIDSSILVHCNGQDASGSTAGAASSAIGTLGIGQPGSNGSTTAASNPGASQPSVATTSTSLVTIGGTGGAATGGPGSGGGSVGGQASSTAGSGSPRNIIQAISLVTQGALKWAAGAGGSGGNGSTGTGGGGGGGAGIVHIIARTLVNNGTLRAKGGIGTNGTGTNAGGGGGGSGGAIVIVYYSAGSTLGTTDVTGGNGGNSIGTGKNGTAGSSGLLWTLDLT